MSALSIRFKKLLGNNEGGMDSFSQCGEDRIIHFIFSALEIKQPSYIDIGAFDPFFINNTALFYKNGSLGINIEPNPHQIKKFLQQRPHDKNLAMGVAEHTGTATFYIMDQKTVSTFSKEDAFRIESEMGIKISETIEVPVMKIADVIDKECQKRFPDLLSIDVEGLDLQIIRSLVGYPTLPKVICAETALFVAEVFGPKNQVLIDEIVGLGYRIYADTFVNTIFLRNDLWK